MKEKCNMPTAERITRTYNVRQPVYEWLEGQAAANRRAVMRQVETILEEAYERDLQQQQGEAAAHDIV